MDKNAGYMHAVRVYLYVLKVLNKVATTHKLNFQQTKMLINMERRTHLLLSIAYVKQNKFESSHKHLEQYLKFT